MALSHMVKLMRENAKLSKAVAALKLVAEYAAELECVFIDTKDKHGCLHCCAVKALKLAEAK